MSKDILEAIKELESNKDIISKQIDMLNNLELKSVNEEEWRRICETPLRYKDVILEIAKATFPNGTDFIRTPNNVKFKIMDFEVLIPTSRNYGIEIEDISELSRLKHTIKSEVKKDTLEKLENRYEAFTNRDISLKNRCDLLGIPSNSKLKLLFKYIVKKRSFNKDLVLKSIRSEKEWINKKTKEKEKAIKEFYMKIEKLRIVVDELKQFAQVKAYFCVDGVWGNYDIKEFFENK